MRSVIKTVITIFLIFSFLPLSWAADPVIGPAPTAAVFVTGAYIVWETDIVANSRVDYGTTTAYGSNVTDASEVTWHKLTITGLTANTTYHYKVTSGATVSADYTFTTYANPTGTVKTVKSSGGDYTTIQQCATASSTGWTCLVYSGSYGTVTSASTNVTFLAQEDATVTSFVLTGRTYNQVKGFNIYNTTTDGVNLKTADNALIENNYIEARGGRGIKAYDDGSSNVDNAVIRKNIIYHTGWTTVGSTYGSEGVYLSGDSNLIEQNNVSHGNDCFVVMGNYIVIRNNTCHHSDVSVLLGGAGHGNNHLDFVQIVGGTLASYTLIEGNTEYICSDSSGNCHFLLIRSGAGDTNTNHIFRHNYAYSIEGGGVGFGGSVDNVPFGKMYNNTLALERTTVNENGTSVSFQRANNGSAINNIFYNSAMNDKSPTVLQDSTGVVWNYNMAHNTGYSGNWGSPYSTEATFATLKNQNPLFSNYPASFAIASNSPAKDAGGPLTTVALADTSSGTSLVVTDASFFQPGWAGTTADWIAVGTVSNIVQISSINYATNTITLANSISRSNGQNVWLYKKSDGVQVLYGTAPDIGAYEYGAGGGGSGLTIPGGVTIR